jgi:hypothetical protein
VLLRFEPAPGFKGIAQAHQFIDASDDAALLGQGWQWNQVVHNG